MLREQHTKADFMVSADYDSAVTAVTDSAVKVTIVRRQSVKKLPVGELLVPGVYVLVGKIGWDENNATEALTQVYVGLSGRNTNKPRKRLAAHVNDPPVPWGRAAVFTSDRASKHWNSAEIGYLEGRLYDILHAMPRIKLGGSRADHDASLTDAEKSGLDKVVPDILAILLVIGVPIDSKSKAPAPNVANVQSSTEPKPIVRKGKRGKPRVKISDLLDVDDLKAGEKFVFSRKNKTVEGTITPNGGMLVNGKEFLNPSSAAVAAFPQELKTADGWKVWKQANKPNKSLLQLRKRYVSSKAASDRK